MVVIDDGMREVFARTGHWHLRGFLDRTQQDAFVEHARALAAVCPFRHPRMRDGREMSVKVSSFGERGWWADEQGYRYINHCPIGRQTRSAASVWATMPIGIGGHHAVVCIPRLRPHALGSRTATDRRTAHRPQDVAANQRMEPELNRHCV